jgi:hypothetical protein
MKHPIVVRQYRPPYPFTAPEVSRYRWIGNTVVRADYSGEVRAMRNLAKRLKDFGHTQDAETVRAGAIGLDAAMAVIFDVTHVEQEHLATFAIADAIRKLGHPPAVTEAY